jgi:hypothetical protein
MGKNNPVYVGKGINGRAYSHLKRSHNKHLDGYIKNNPVEVLFYMENLTEENAFRIEQDLIKYYGRKDLGTGCLFNHTDGGEGVFGHT